MTEQEIRDEVAKRQWFHCVHLPHGIVTPGTRERDAWEMYKLPQKMDGMRVLDIGAWEGQFSFEAERRGASEVVAMDLWGRGDAGSIGAGRDNFEFCHDAIGSSVISVNRSVYDLPSNLGQFDVVLFLEVLYHLQNPLLGLQKIADVCRGWLFLETWIDALSVKEPAMIYYEGSELNGDPTNWWGPNPACVEAMLRTVGFKDVTMPWSRPDAHFGGRGRRAIFHARK